MKDHIITELNKVEQAFNEHMLSNTQRASLHLAKRILQWSLNPELESPVEIILELNRKLVFNYETRKHTEFKRENINAPWVQVRVS